MLLICGATPFLNTNTGSCRERYNDPMPPLGLHQTQRFFISEIDRVGRSEKLAHLDQCMQTKWIEPSTECAAACPSAVRRKVSNSAADISPQAIAKSSCLTAPSPDTLPAIGMFQGGSVKTICARSSPSRRP